MKMLFILCAFLAVNFAHASYYATHCSNSTGSVKWETGHNSNTISFTYWDVEKQVKSLPIYHVKIEAADTVTIREENVRRCGYAGSTKVYVQKVTITPAPEYPEVLEFLNSDNKVQAEVICTSEMNGRAPCPREDEETEEKP